MRGVTSTLTPSFPLTIDMELKVGGTSERSRESKQGSKEKSISRVEAQNMEGDL